MATELVCPKCHGAMRTYERNRVTIDQCVDCRGIFLDRGELERLIDAEAAYNAAAAPAAPPAPASAPPVYGYQDSRGGYRDERQGDYRGDYKHDDYKHGGHKRRKSFLGDLFD